MTHRSLCTKPGVGLRRDWFTPSLLEMPSPPWGGQGAVPGKTRRELHFLNDTGVPERHREMKQPGEWGVCLGDKDQG